MAEPATAEVFAPHWVQFKLEVAFGVALAVPAEQLAQVPAVVPPQPVKYVPAAQLEAQAVQLSAFPRLYVLLEHAAQEPAEAPPQPDRYEPCAHVDVQVVHDEAPAPL